MVLSADAFSGAAALRVATARRARHGVTTRLPNSRPAIARTTNTAKQRPSRLQHEVVVDVLHGMKADQRQEHPERDERPRPPRP